MILVPYPSWNSPESKFVWVIVARSGRIAFSAVCDNCHTSCAALVGTVVAAAERGPTSKNRSGMSDIHGTKTILQNSMSPH